MSEAITRWRHVLWYALLVSLSARADTPSPSVEFWQYFAQYSDDNGELFDPIDLVETEKNLKAQLKTSNDSDDTQEKQP
jgi:hypothetical protein